MRSLSITSPAKLNLSLRVLGKQKDGYHRLHTIFHRISLQDTIQIRKIKEEKIRLVCSHPRVPIRENLLVRAFQLLKKECPFEGGVSARLTKKIPVGGGLGGGSSNAASFLIGMNRLYRLKLSLSALMRLGRKLGADVPFFVSGAQHAVGTGLGDKIHCISFPRKLWFLLVFDRRPLSTRSVFQRFRPARPVALTRVIHDATMAQNFLKKGQLERAVRFLRNDLTASAETIRPSLARQRKRLCELQLGTWQMSGSGPTTFCVFSSRREVLQAFRKLRLHGFSGKVSVCHSS